MTMRYARPFIKWLGGKGQLLDQLDVLLPPQLKAGKVRKYAEPFIGGGAMFFHIAQKYKVDEFMISDVNKDLILTYNIIKFNVSELINSLVELQDKYMSLNSIEDKSDLYYTIRDEFNNMVIDDYNDLNDKSIRKATYLIFLNKTCFNGIFRVNQEGKFNTSFGKYEKINVCDIENLKAVSDVLQKTKIVCADYRYIFDYVDNETFVYLDPPYRPISKTANFTKYYGVFDENEQINLAYFFARLDNEKKALLMLSNSDPKNVNKDDDFFENLYSKYFIKRVAAKRNVSCRADSRLPVSEIVITNY